MVKQMAHRLLKVWSRGGSEPKFLGNVGMFLNIQGGNAHARHGTVGQRGAHIIVIRAV